MKKSAFILSLVGLLILATITALAIIMPNRLDNQDRFSVTGSGVVYAKADIANITIGFKTELKKEAALAAQESSLKMNAIIDSLNELGIEEKDIKTTDYNLRPVYTWLEKEGQVLQGYEVFQNVTVKVRELDKIGEVISRTTEKGANQVGSVNFSIDDEYELKNEARELAIEKAKEKAQLIAAQSGMKLGRIKSVYENDNINYPMPMYANAKMEMADGLGGVAVDVSNIQVGQNEIRVEVTLVYEVK
jgi:uncharacterized protein